MVAGVLGDLCPRGEDQELLKCLPGLVVTQISEAWGCGAGGAGAGSGGACEGGGGAGGGGNFQIHRQHGRAA